MKLYTLKSKVYENKEGKAIAIQSSRTGNTICLFQQYFTPEILGLYRRIELLQLQKPRHLNVAVAYSMQELKEIHWHYLRQQVARGIKPYRGR